jgi:hypothetical protein
MMSREPFPFKKTAFKALILFAAVLLADALFVAAISLWIGFIHHDHQGYWMPLFTGGLLAVLAVWLFIRFFAVILRVMRRSDLLSP